MAEATIVFRNEVGETTPKIYVDTLEAAAGLAAKYRYASHIVDVINRRDEVALRWVDGAPDCKPGQVRPIKLDVPAYEFPKDRGYFIEAENRLRLLADAIPFAFDSATGKADEVTFETLQAQTEHHGGDDVWELVRDARITAETAAQTSSPAEWAAAIDCWMSDPAKLFVPYLVEFTALGMKVPNILVEIRVARLGTELAEMECGRGEETR